MTAEAIAASQNILRPERNDGRDYQRKEHQDQHEWIDHDIAPRMQKVYVAAQVLGYFFRRMDFRRGLQLWRRGLFSLLPASQVLNIVLHLALVIFRSSFGVLLIIGHIVFGAVDVLVIQVFVMLVKTSSFVRAIRIRAFFIQSVER